MSRASRQQEILKLYEKKENGRYRYIGQWLTLERQQKKAPFLILFWTQLALTIAAAVGMMFTPAGPMISYRAESFNYVMLLFCLTCLCSLACGYYTLKVAASKLWIEEHDAKYPDWHMIFSALTAAAAICVVIGQLIYVFSAGHPDDLVWDILFLAEALVCAVINGLSWWFQKGMKWTYLPNDAK